MYIRRFSFLPFVLFLCFPVFAGTSFSKQDTPCITRDFSFDIIYMLMGVRNKGWGLGIKYERQIYRNFSITGGFAHSTLYTGENDVWCTTVDVQLTASYYPFASDLRGYFITAGSCTDFLNYFGNVPDDKDNGTSLISALALTGWRFVLSKQTAFDIYTGWKHIFKEGYTFGNRNSYISSGLQAGVSFKKIL